jgi:predicted dithiol-disulfide oxidoreductase (DUF899 family)
MAEHQVVSHEQWLEARKALLAKEKEFTRLRDQLSVERRALPWEEVTKEYRFEGPDGKVSLTDLFGRSSQMVVYHFMFDPGWDAGCPHCSFWADNFDGAAVHLKARDVSFVTISRAPYDKIATYRNRMGWSFPWYSASETDFNYDLGASFTPDDLAAGTAVYNYFQDPGMEDREGLSVFYKDQDKRIFHTYSTYARGIDMINGTYQILDLTPKGRDEGDGDPQFWVRRHDEYPR